MVPTQYTQSRLTGGKAEEGSFGLNHNYECLVKGLDFDTYSFKKYLLTFYDGPDCGLGTRDRVDSKTDMIPVLLELMGLT